MANMAYGKNAKEADLAGTWYPASKGELEDLLQGYLDAAAPDKIGGRIFAIISPHAGYQFSGPVAAYGFKAVKSQKIKTVIVIGFSHRKFFNGISVYSAGSFRTPLGEIPVDGKLAGDIIKNNKRISFYPQLFDDENSVEMQIPFIQVSLKGARIVPIAFGTQEFGDAVILADALAKALKDRDDYLIVASTDMSHYHPYDEANSIDRRAISLLEKMNAKDLYDEGMARNCELCGMMPVTATLLAADKLGYTGIKVLKHANSGDTFGPKDNVVGYASAVIYREGDRRKNKETSVLTAAQKARLLEIARESITSYVRGGKRKAYTESDAILNEPMGAFVTLKEAGELRGCIGNMVGQGPLYKTVADMAIEAATGDPRFSRLSPDEIDKIDIEISVLTPLKKVKSYEDVKIPGDGVLIRKGFASGVYLPQVADETGWNREQFLTSLAAHKAGLPANAWKDPQTDIYVFNAEVFSEKTGKGDEGEE